MAGFPKDRKHDFNLDLVLKFLKKSLSEDGLVILDDYLMAYHELCRFFKMTGPIFSFVARDLESKVKAIEALKLQSGGQTNYHSVHSMIAFEKSEQITHRKGSHPSGCRTFLRLHWALEFILAFMKRLTVGDDHEKSSKIAWEIYRQTLYNHHPWITQKLAGVAVYALPSKRVLIETMCKHSYEEVQQLLDQVVAAGQPVFDATQNLFECNGLLDIP